MEGPGKRTVPVCIVGVPGLFLLPSDSVFVVHLLVLIGLARGVVVSCDFVNGHFGGPALVGVASVLLLFALVPAMIVLLISVVVCLV